MLLELLSLNPLLQHEGRGWGEERKDAGPIEVLQAERRKTTCLRTESACFLPSFQNKFTLEHVSNDIIKFVKKHGQNSTLFFPQLSKYTSTEEYRKPLFVKK